jgi:hypothetical protein
VIVAPSRRMRSPSGKSLNSKGWHFLRRNAQLPGRNLGYFGSGRVTPTKFFHTHANAQRRRNFISSLEHEGQVLVAEHGKARAWYDFFDDVLGSLAVRTSGVLLEALGLPYLDLQQLGLWFTKEEVWTVISSLPPDKAPGPDRSRSSFCKWPSQILDWMLWLCSTRSGIWT